MAASGEAAQHDTLVLPAGATPATVPKGEDVAIPMLYEKSLEAVRRALALHDPAVLPCSCQAGDGGEDDGDDITPLHSALIALRAPGVPARALRIVQIPAIR